MKTINNLYQDLVVYIENNKENNNIDYKESIEALEEILNAIKEDYRRIGVDV